MLKNKSVENSTYCNHFSATPQINTVILPTTVRDLEFKNSCLPCSLLFVVFFYFVLPLFFGLFIKIPGK